MKRKTLDRLLTWVGALLTLMLLVAGGGLLLGSTFTSNQVHSQLVGQKVFFPTKGSMDYQDLVVSHETQYAGQQMVTGIEAKVYADDVIGADVAHITGGKTYAQISAASLADPSNTALAAEVQTVFRGDTLQGLLLNAYAFGYIAVLALYGAIASFVLALIMFVLTLFGVRHYRVTDPADEV